MKYTNIGIDLDGVLADFVDVMIGILRYRLHIDLPDGFQPTSWEWANGNLPKDAFANAWKIIDSDETFWEKLMPLHMEVATMKEFFHRASDRYNIYFITARKDGLIGNSAKRQSENWLEKHLDQPKSNLTVLPVKHALDKLPMLDALGIDYFVDDHAETIHQAHLKCPNTQSYLFARPWNMYRREGVAVVESLKDFLIEVENNR